MKSKKSTEQPYSIRGADLLFQSTNLSDEPEQSSDIPLEKIIPRPNQPRRYFDSESLEILAESIKEKGVLQPILVRSIEDNRYEIVAGERRFRAAKIAGLDTIPIIVKEFNEEETAEIALLENIQREDLNPVEETQAVLELLAFKLNQTQNDIISMLNTASHAGRESAVNVTRQEEWDVLANILKAVGYTPESFRTQRLPLLNLPPDILEAVQQGKIAYTKALALVRGVKDSEQRRILLEETIEQNLPLKVLKEKIADLKKGNQINQKANSIDTGAQLVDRMASLYKRAKSPSKWQDKTKQKQLTRLLNELEKLLDN